MSIDNRDYMRNSGASGRGNGPSSWSVLTWLIVINVAIYFIQIFSNTYAGSSNFLALNVERLFSWQAYTLATHQFSHGHLAHLLFNMVGLFFLGRLLLEWIHSRHLLPIFLLGGVAGGLMQCGYNAMTGSSLSMIVGASGSIMAILFAAVALNPHREIRFLFMFFIPVRLTMRNIALLVIAIDLITFLSQLYSGGRARPDGTLEQTAVFAHLGGMVMGFFYMKTLYAFFEQRGNRQKQDKAKKKKFGIRVIRDVKAKDISDGKSAKKSKKPYVSTDVDAILDKISAEGIHSLTPEEKKTLEKSSQKLSRKVDGK